MRYLTGHTFNLSFGRQRRADLCEFWPASESLSQNQSKPKGKGGFLEAFLALQAPTLSLTPCLQQASWVAVSPECADPDACVSAAGAS